MGLRRKHRSTSTFAMAFVALLWGTLIPAGPATAQSIEYEIPTEINVVPGRLSVTFQDTVSRQEAAGLLKQQGIDVITWKFEDVSIHVATPARLSGAEKKTLTTRHGVKSVKEYKGERPAWLQSQMGTESFHTYTIYLEGSVSPAYASQIVAYLPGAVSFGSERWPNEVIVRSGDDEEQTIGTLESSPLVKYVTYVAAEQ